MAYISVNGFNHYYEWLTESGDNQPSGKPVLVFIHGWGGSVRYWESTARSLSHHFDCLLYDMRGFGRSRMENAPESTYKLDVYVRDLAGLLIALRLQKVCLNAHSTGASVAVLFLNRYAEFVDRAVLTCSGIFEYQERAFKAFHQFGGYVVKFRFPWLYSLPFTDRLFMQRFLHQSVSRDMSRAFLDDFLMADEAAALGTMVSAVSKEAAETMPAEFARISIPTLLISGEYDQIIPAEMGKQAAILNDRIQQITIPNTAHFPMLEDPKTYLQSVTEFLDAEAPAVL
ncbi:MAG TPA: alpha/beta hydrolase [Leptolyngbya sp.]|jgi:pimeloyl-ACP methyl ester carboxylesterase|nr:alpha/beta hydrolase [Leptolyngbya sp.]